MFVSLPGMPFLCLSHLNPVFPLGLSFTLSCLQACWPKPTYGNAPVCTWVHNVCKTPVCLCLSLPHWKLLMSRPSWGPVQTVHQKSVSLCL